MSYRYSDRAAFRLEPPPAEVLPLLALRRSLHRWGVAHDWAAEVVEQARLAPQDATLARCVGQLADEEATCRDLAARAVQVWAGDRTGTVFVRDRGNSDPSVLLVLLGDRPMISVVRPGEVSFPDEAAEVFDLVAAEEDLICRSISAVETDPGRRERACAAARKESRKSPLWEALGSGDHTPASLAWIYANTTKPEG